MKKRNIKRISGNSQGLALSILQRAFYNNLEVLVDEEMAELMRDHKVRAWAEKITIEAFELILSKMKKRWNYKPR